MCVDVPVELQKAPLPFKVQRERQMPTAAGLGEVGSSISEPKVMDSKPGNLN